MIISGKTIFNDEKQSVCDIDSYRVITEAPVAAGGSGAYPPATRMVLAALMNCKISALGAFCLARSIDCSGLAFEFEADFEKGIYQAIRLKIALPADFPEKYKESVEAMLATCSVEKIIRNFPEIILEII